MNRFDNRRFSKPYSLTLKNSEAQKQQKDQTKAILNVHRAQSQSALPIILITHAVLIALFDF